MASAYGMGSPGPSIRAYSRLTNRPRRLSGRLFELRAIALRRGFCEQYVTGGKIEAAEYAARQDDADQQQSDAFGRNQECQRRHELFDVATPQQVEMGEDAKRDQDKHRGGNADPDGRLQRQAERELLELIRIDEFVWNGPVPQIGGGTQAKRDEGHPPKENRKHNGYAHIASPFHGFGAIRRPIPTKPGRSRCRCRDAPDQVSTFVAMVLKVAARLVPSSDRQ